MERPIGIMGAFKEEVAGIRQAMKVEAQSTFSDIEFTRGFYGGKEVVLTLSGIGEEKASRAAQALLDNFPLKTLICIGIAGALHPTLEIGDIVIGKRVFSQTSAQRFLTSDEKLVEAAVRSCDHLRYRFFLGDILTVSRIIDSSTEKREIYQDTQALAVEMETVAVAHWAMQKEIPFLALRSISDGADYIFKVDIPRVTDDEGELNPRKVLCYLLRHPTALIGLWQMKQNITKATEHLEKVIHSLIAEI